MREGVKISGPCRVSGNPSSLGRWSRSIAYSPIGSLITGMGRDENQACWTSGVRTSDGPLFRMNQVGACQCWHSLSGSLVHKRVTFNRRYPVSCYGQFKGQLPSPNCRNRMTAASRPPFSNELFGLFIESLGEDLPSLRACSLVCRVFHHFCGPNLHRSIELDRKENLDTFLQFGERSGCLIHTKSLSLTYNGFEAKAHLRKPRKILEVFSRKASLETLRLHRIQFHAETFTGSLLSNLSTVRALILQECNFGGFEDFVTFIRSFPRCQVLCFRLRTWIREPPKLRFSGSPVYDLSLTHLEITTTSTPELVESCCDHGKIVGMPWLNLAGLKSFTYKIEEDTVSGPVLERIAACEHLEEMDMALSSSGGRAFGEGVLPLLQLFGVRMLTKLLDQLGIANNQLTRFIVRIKSLTLRCSVGLLPWLPSFPHTAPFPSSSTLERIRIVTARLPPTIEGYKVLDATFSDVEKYPSLVELEVCSSRGTRVGREARVTLERLCVDERLPRLKALGRLPPSPQPEPVECVQSVDTFGSVAGAYYRALT